MRHRRIKLNQEITEKQNSREERNRSECDIYPRRGSLGRASDEETWQSGGTIAQSLDEAFGVRRECSAARSLIRTRDNKKNKRRKGCSL